MFRLSATQEGAALQGQQSWCPCLVLAYSGLMISRLDSSPACALAAPRSTTIGFGASAIGFSWAAPNKAGDTSPAHVGSTGCDGAVAVERLRRIKVSLPSSTATLILSACLGVTSRVTVRPKVPGAVPGAGFCASTTRTRTF